MAKNTGRHSRYATGEHTLPETFWIRRDPSVGRFVAAKARGGLFGRRPSRLSQLRRRLRLI